MTDEQKILLALVKLMFPREMLDYFEVVGFELHEDSISVRLDERDRILKKKSGHTYVKNGFLPESRITDFPIRDKRATLIVRRRRGMEQQRKRAQRAALHLLMMARGGRENGALRRNPNAITLNSLSDT